MKTEASWRAVGKRVLRVCLFPTAFLSFLSAEHSRPFLPVKQSEKIYFYVQILDETASNLLYDLSR